MTIAPTLRPYQIDAGLALERAFFDQGLNRLLGKKPTGTGKTVWFASLPTQFPRLKAWLAGFPKHGAKMLVIAHREELLDQAAAKILAANPTMNVSIEQGDRRASRYSDVVVASIQTLAATKFRRLRRLLEHHTFRLVIVDEAHHTAATTYRAALVMLGFLPRVASEDENSIEAADYDDVEAMKKDLEGWDVVAPKDRLLVGVTATPNRSDNIGLGCVYQTLFVSYGLKQAIKDGWLVKIKPWVIETADSLDDVKMTHGDFNQKALAEKVNNAKRNLLGYEAWKLHAGDCPTLAFTVDVAHAYAVADLWRSRGVQAEAISGETPKDDRHRILRQYQEGQVQFISNCMVLTEGTDLPRTSCILHLKPTKSATLYEQMTGRGLRLFPGKKECIVIDLVDIARRHSLQAAPVLYGLPPGIKTQGEELDDIEGSIEKFKEDFPNFDIEAEMAGNHWSIAELLARSSSIDVWAVPSMGIYSGAVTMDWIKTSETSFRLQYPWQNGYEVLTVAPDLVGHFDLVATFREKDSHHKRQRTLAAGVMTAQDALQLGEAYVGTERKQVTRLKANDAPWKSDPASKPQLGALRGMGIPHRPGITKGEASALLDLASARRAAGGRR